MRVFGWVAALAAMAFVCVFSYGQDAPKQDEPKKEDEKKEWKIEDPHGPFKPVEFATEEGTWISADVDPNGNRLVFDLLGDLYTLPTEGGVATRLTVGRAWDYEPRFSPDGRFISFSSDRGGTENVWLMNTDGTDPRPLTQQKDKVTCGAEWSPDNRYLIVRRRFTDKSSIGTVELWMVDVSGGTGIQITSKDKYGDVQGPVFSPDGKYLYFSGRKERFQYNRDPGEGFWTLERFDRDNGEFRTLAAQPGGYGQARVSNDGKKLAFVRRVRGKTCLFVHDLATGGERQVLDSLDPDQMEGFAWNGLYPSYDWLPDNRHLVITAQGKLWKVDMDTGERINIPFKVTVNAEITDALCFPQDIDSDTTEIKMLRQPAQNPVTGQWVFSALSHLYSCAGKENELPKRLTESAQLEYCPNFDSAGELITYVGWTDAEGGRIYTCKADGSNVLRVTEQAGNYLNPAFSPEANQIAFIRGSGGYLRGNMLRNEDWWELCVVDATGGGDIVPICRLKGVSRISYALDGRRIFYTENEGEKKESLKSIRLDGTEVHTHLTTEFFQEIAVSPNGNWLAYQYDHQVWVTAIPQGVGGRDYEIGDTLPKIQLSKNGGDYPQWTRDGEVVTFSLGNTLYSVELQDAVDKALKKQRKIGKKEEWEITPQACKVPFAVESYRPEGAVAYTHARIITMNGDEVLEDATLVTNGNKIEAVGPHASVVIPNGANVVDCTGKTMIPGFVDAHAHMHFHFYEVFPEWESTYIANLAYGVTTIHDPSARNSIVFTGGERVAAGELVGPRVFSTGEILYGADGPMHVQIDNFEDAQMHLRRMKAYGAISVKSYMQPRREQRQWIIEAAREEKMLVMPEGGGKFFENLGMVLDGHTGIEHSLSVAPYYNDVVQLFAHSQTGNTPTMLVAYGGLFGERWFYQNYDAWEDEKLMRFTNAAAFDAKARRREMAPDEDYHHFEVAKGLKKLVEAGVRVNLGSHGQLQGLGAHWDLWAMAQGGMKNHDVLRCGTIFPAGYIGMDHLIGSIAPGKLADLQILDNNPLEDIHYTNTHVYVVVNGRLFDATTMNQLWPEEKPLPKFYWQR